jgi:hypothetical protein
MDSAYWNNRPLPKDQEGYVFVARAVHEIGRKRYGNGWDAAVLDVASSEREASHVDDHAELALPAGSERWSSEAVGMSLARIRMHRAAEARRRITEARARFERLLGPIRDGIAEAALSGKLKAKLRAVEGGELVPASPSLWATEGETLRARFIRGQLSTLRPFEGKPEGGWFIFFERGSLDTLLAPLEAARTTAGDAPPLEASVPFAIWRGAVSYSKDDAILIAEMHELIQSRVAPSILAAAGMVVSRAVGLGENDSKIDRLRRRYRKAYP